ncbi:MAG: amino acid adenylation domain-containing protein, partial [Byssovorax sp.]
MSRKNVEDIYALSPMQQGILFHTLYAERPGAYHIQYDATIEGDLDVPAFLRAFEAVIERHSILRTAFVWERLDRPMQVVREKVSLPFAEHDLRGESHDAQESFMARLLADDRQRGFDLRKAPLTRVALVRLGEERRRFVWSIHHILVDGWSAALILKEVFTCYDAFSAGKAPRLEAARPYVELIRWLKKQDPAKAEPFFRRALKGFSAPTPLGVDHPPAGDERFGEKGLLLPEAEAEALIAFARREQITPSTLIQGAWALLLSRYSGEEDVLFGATVSGRSAPVPGIDRMVGLFINTMPVRVSARPSASVSSFLRGLQAQQAEMREHEHVPLVEILAQSEVPRGTPLFESLLVFDNYPVEATARREARAVTMIEPRVSERPAYPLMVVGVFRRTLSLKIGYDGRRFDDAVIERMLGHLRQLLGEMVRSPSRSLGELSLLTPEERSFVVFACNDTAAPFPDEATFHQLFYEQVDRAPGALALSFEGRDVSYEALAERVNRLAFWLIEAGIGPGARVGIAAERSIEMIVGLLGVLASGAAYVPIDPSSPEERFLFLADDARASILLTQRHLLSRLRPALDKRPALRTLCLDEGEPELTDLPSSRPPVIGRAGDPAYVIYTSGSTGLPKGVLGSHRSAINRFAWMWRAYPFMPGERSAQKTTLSFVDSIWEIFGPLLQGVPLVLLSDSVLKDIPRFIDALAEARVTRLVLVPSLLRVMLDAAPDLAARLPDLHCWTSSGETLTADLTARFLAALPGRVLLNLYGSSEVAADATFFEPSRTAFSGSVPIGKPISNLRAYVLDGHLSPVPVGVTGEIYVGGAGVAEGYLDRPGLTAERFLADPFVPGERLYKTGDLGRRLPSGDLEYLGRADFQVKIRGYRIELGEVESTLLGHPAVREAVAAARSYGPDDIRLVAYVTPRAERPRVSELRAHLQQKLPEHLIPSILVVLDRFPLLPSGKVDRRALPAPESGPAVEREHVEPRGPVEEAIALIFAEVLKLPPDRVGAHDGFFDLGGHSLLGTQAMARIRAAFSVDLPLKALFEAGTPAELGARVIAALREGQGLSAPPLVRVPRDGDLPLSFGQERLWFLDQLEPGDPTYVVPFAVRLEGRLDIAALEQAISALVARHEVLRTSYASIEGRPVPVIHEAMTISLPVVDLSGGPAESREERLRAAVAEEVRVPFDLTRGPVIRARLFRLGEASAALVVALHHIVSDAWTRAIINREITLLYRAFAAGEPSPLPDLPIQYADYAAWQRRFMSGPTLEAELGYWKKRLEGASFVLDLPLDRPRPPAQSHRGARARALLPAELTRALKDLARREGATLFMALLAGLDLLFFRITGQTDILIGTSSGNRAHPETEGLIGFFINALVLRVEMTADMTGRDLLARVKETCLGAYAHDDLPFERLVQEIGPGPDPSRAPLFQVIFTMHNAPREDMALEGLALRGLRAETATAKFDLTFLMGEGPAGLSIALEYATDLFEHRTIERMLAQLTLLLEGLAGDPHKRISELPILSEQERTMLLVGWNRTEVAYPAEHCLHQLFEAAVDRRPDAPALVAGGETLTYRALDERANRLAHHLRARGIGPDQVVALCLDRSADWVVGMLAILKAGAAYLPLDPHHPAGRIAQIVDEAGPSLCLSATRLSGSLPAEGLTILHLDELGEALASERTDRPESGVSPQNLAYLLFTSGSSGTPKGVAVEHRQIVNYTLGVSERLGLPPDGAYAHVSTLTADLGNTVLFPSLCRGGTLHLLDEALTSDPAGLAAYFEAHPIDVLKIVPSHLGALLSAPSPSRVIPRTLLVLGGEAARWSLIETIERLSPGTRIANHYGPTETTVGVLTYAIDAAGSRADSPIVPLGRPLPNSRIYLLDASLSPVPLGVPGEVFIGGAGVARGYHHRPDLTRERFIPDPFGRPGERLYRTGDRARYLPDGNILFLGRIDAQVKIRGNRIELGEIEAALAAHPGIRQAVIQAEEAMSGDMQLCAYVVPVEAPGPSTVELSAFLSERLPSFMVPSTVVTIDAVPLTKNGKIDRRALTALGQAAQQRNAGEEASAPRTPIEEILTGIWIDVFGKARIGVHESFTDLGGHSLLAIQIIARARDAFQVDIPLRAIFESPTIAALGAKIEGALREGQGLIVPPITRAPRGRPLPLSFAQERLWFLASLEPESPFYNVPSALRFSGALDPAVLERALQEVIARHEVLRTTFASIDGAPAQIIHDTIDLRLPVVDRPDLGADPAAIRAVMEDEAKRPFDLERGPLIRARLLRLGEAEHLLLLTMHHIVSDAWTRGILNREIGVLYRAFLAGEPSPLPPLPIQYADYAEHQRRWLSGAALDTEIAYWVRQLAGAPAALDLPADRPRPPIESHRGDRLGFALSRPLSDALLALSRKEGATPFMTLLAAFETFLFRITGQGDLVVGTPAIHRTIPETEGLIGFFLNNLVLRTSIEGALSFRALLGRVRETCLGAYAHQSLPFERLVQAISPARDLSRAPVFQVLFTLQNAPRESLRLPGLTIKGASGESNTAKLDLSLWMGEGPDGLVGSFEYATDLFDRAT